MKKDKALMDYNYEIVHMRDIHVNNQRRTRRNEHEDPIHLASLEAARSIRKAEVEMWYVHIQRIDR